MRRDHEAGAGGDRGSGSCARYRIRVRKAQAGRNRTNMNDAESCSQYVAIASGDSRLAARFYSAGAKSTANLVLHGATGIPQSFYSPFAQWCATQNVGVLTYDYQDSAASRQEPMKVSRATMSIWGLEDQAAAEKKLLELAPVGPLWVIGHSLGGLMFPFRPYPERFVHMTTVGAGFAYVGDHPLAYRLRALAFWYLLGPLATAVLGYLPGKRLFLGADLPAGVYWQWRRWCTNKGFYRPEIGKALPEPNFGEQGFQLRMFGAADDPTVTPAAVARYANAFAAGTEEPVILNPEQFGAISFGHVGIFSKRNATVWPTILGIASG